MSFILDALRKSETQRQRQAGPGIAETGYRPPAPRRSLWVPVLIAVLVANLVLLAAFWMRNGTRGPATTPGTARSDTPPTSTAPASVPTPHVVTPASAARAAGVDDMAPVSPADSSPDLAANGPRTEVLEPPLGSGFAATGPPGGSTAQVPAVATTGDLPSADQLVTTGVLTGPPLHLDLHVYSTRPADRFVFINTRKYLEGAEVQDGIRVEQITPDGVVLSKNGTRFSLPRE